MKVPTWVTATLLPISVIAMADVAISMTPASVTWIKPESFRDIRTTAGSQQRFQEQVFEILTEQFSDMAKIYLAPEQTLSVEVFDLNLAGEPRRSSATGQQFRILTSTTPPAISFSYKIKQGEEVIKSDNVRLTDLNYQASIPAINRDGALVYEKQLILNWARKSLRN